MPLVRKAWSKRELLTVFRLYLQTPFGRLHRLNPEIIKLAELIGRTPGAVAMKACNFASIDPDQKSRHIRALGNTSRADRELWEAFLKDAEGIAEKAEAAYIATVCGEEKESLRQSGSMPGEISASYCKGHVSEESNAPGGPTEVDMLVRSRRVQSFFRTAVLASYDNHCALTDLAIPEMLNASHIIPWSVDIKRRADPRNGICLNTFHDRAFDRGLITFDDDLRVIVSSSIGDFEECDIQRNELVGIQGRRLRQPTRFRPESAALEYHRNHIYRP